MSNTIAAISTAPGIGGIGIIRMSGDNCFDVLEIPYIKDCYNFHCLEYIS